MISVRRPRPFVRALFTAALCISGAASVAARPFAPGITYRLRVVNTPPDMPGMSMPTTTIIGHGLAMGSLSRLDIDSVSGQMPLTVGDYMLMLDSGRVVMVSPSTKSYSDGLPGMSAMPPELLAQAVFTNVNITTEKLGAGESIQGFATTKYRITTTYNLGIMGQSLNTMSTSEIWVAELPGSTVSTAFDGGIPKSMADGPMKEMFEKTMAARATIGKGTPLKTITTATISGPMPTPLTTMNTVEMVDVKIGDVDASAFRIPEGFTRKP